MRQRERSGIESSMRNSDSSESFSDYLSEASSEESSEECVATTTTTATTATLYSPHTLREYRVLSTTSNALPSVLVIIDGQQPNSAFSSSSCDGGEVDRAFVCQLRLGSGGRESSSANIRSPAIDATANTAAAVAAAATAAAGTEGVGWI